MTWAGTSYAEGPAESPGRIVQRDVRHAGRGRAPRVGPAVVDGFPEWLEGRKYFRRDQELGAAAAWASCIDTGTRASIAWSP